MSHTIDVNTLDKDQGISQGQIGVLNKIRFSLSNIWSNLTLENGEKTLAVGFSACARGDGASFVALNMALLLAHEYEIKTLYVDADIEKPKGKGDAFLQGSSHEGLQHFLAEERELEGLIKNTRIPNLHVLASGVHGAKQLPHNPSRQGVNINHLLELCRRDYGAVIFDLAPLSLSPWALSVGMAVDSVVFVCRYAQSRRQVCMHGLERVKKHGVPFAGMILNERDYPIPMSIYNWLK